MTKVTVFAGLGGLLIGLAVSAYAHGANGFLSGPVVFLSLALSALGVIAAGVLMIGMRKRGPAPSAIGAFSIAMLAALVVLPVIWPYQSPAGPVPLNGQEPAPSKKL